MCGTGRPTRLVRGDQEPVWPPGRSRRRYSGRQQAARFLQHFAAPEYQLPLTAADLLPEGGRTQAGQQNGAHKGRLFRLLENLGLAADGQAKAQGGYLALVNIGQLGNDAVVQRLVAVAPGLSTRSRSFPMACSLAG